MKHLFVSLILATKLKEIGFYYPCLAYYVISDKVKGGWKLFYNEHEDHNPLINNIQNNRLITAPLYQQVIDWLREKHINIIELPETFPTKWCVTTNGNFIGAYVIDEAIEKALEILK